MPQIYSSRMHAMGCRSVAIFKSILPFGSKVILSKEWHYVVMLNRVDKLMKYPVRKNGIIMITRGSTS